MRNRADSPDKQGRLNERLKAIVQGSALTPDTTPSRSERSAAFKQGTLVLPHGERVPVVVKNRSRTGVRIDFIKNCELGEHARMTVPSMGLDRRVRIVWRKDGSAGLEFI